MSRLLPRLLLLGAVAAFAACAAAPPAPPLDGPSGLRAAVVETFGLE